jgi:hypothetical protein
MTEAHLAQDIQDHSIDERDQRKPTRWTRPIILVLLYLLIAYVLVFAYSDGISPALGLSPALVRGAVTELRISICLASIFWLCLRVHEVTWSERIVPIVCVLHSLLMELRIDPFSQRYDPASIWALAYRYGAVAIFFWLGHRTFRLSIQPVRSHQQTLSLNLRQLLIAISLIAVLLGSDAMLRSTREIPGQMKEMSDPPWLAFSFSVSRASLWIGAAIFASRPGREGVFVSVLLHLFWLISRTAILLYLAFVLYPKAQSVAPVGWYPTLDELILFQIVQFVFAWITVAAILCFGSRFRISNKTIVQDNLNRDQVRFDSVV